MKYKSGTVECSNFSWKGCWQKGISNGQKCLRNLITQFVVKLLRLRVTSSFEHGQWKTTKHTLKVIRGLARADTPICCCYIIASSCCDLRNYGMYVVWPGSRLCSGGGILMVVCIELLWSLGSSNNKTACIFLPFFWGHGICPNQEIVNAP